MQVGSRLVVTIPSNDARLEGLATDLYPVPLEILSPRP